MISAFALLSPCVCFMKYHDSAVVLSRPCVNTLCMDPYGKCSAFLYREENDLRGVS